MKKADITGRRALVTGASSGIGRATALELSREGAELFLVDISGEVLEKVALEVEALGARAHTFCVDLAEWSQVKSMADTILSRWGPPDILINCAGILHMCHVMQTSLDDWNRLLGANLLSVVHTVKAFGPGMIERRSGRIVNVSSAQAFFAVPTTGPYACTKYAVDGYSEALRYELSLHGVGVTTVYPGVVRTSLYDRIEGGPLVRIGLKLILLAAARPESLSRMIVRGIRKGKKLVLPPEVWAVYLSKRVFPWPFEAAGRAAAWALRGEGGVKEDA